MQGEVAKIKQDLKRSEEARKDLFGMLEKFTSVILRKCSVPVQKVSLSEANIKAHLNAVIEKLEKAFKDDQSSKKFEEPVSSSSFSSGKESEVFRPPQEYGAEQENRNIMANSSNNSGFVLPNYGF